MRSAAVAVLAFAAFAAFAAAASAHTVPEIAAPLPTGGHAAEVSYGATTPPPLNLASDKTALNAYATYLNSVVKDATLGEDNVTTYVSTISSQCKGALAPLVEPSSQVDTAAQSTLTALGEEMGDDLSISFDLPAFSPFMRLATTLSRLRWNRMSGGGAIVRKYVNTETNVLDATQSDLCQNALLAASAPETVPPDTKTFIKSYARQSNAANNALANFLKLMQTYETSAERQVVTRISNLANQVTKLSKSNMLTSASSLTSALESS